MLRGFLGLRSGPKVSIFSLRHNVSIALAVFTFLIAFVRQEMEAYMGYAQMRMRELDEKIAAHQKESDQVFIDKIKSAYPELDQSHLEEIIERSRKRPRPSLWSRLKRIVFDV